MIRLGHVSFFGCVTSLSLRLFRAVCVLRHDLDKQSVATQQVARAPSLARSQTDNSARLVIDNASLSDLTMMLNQTY